MTASEQKSSSWPRIIRGALTLAALAIVILLLAMLALSPLPMRGAELFGALANKIKGNPGATTAICLVSGGALWLGLGLIAAGQEWLAARRRAP